MTAEITTERKPGKRNPNSNMAKVYPFLLRGDLNPVISAGTGLEGTVLIEAVRAIYRRGFIPLPSPEEQRIRHRRNTSIAKGGIQVAIEEYFPLDLTARQTQIALRVDRNIIIDNFKKITTAYGRERLRNGLQRPVKELMVEAQRDKHRTPEELLDIVRKRQTAYRCVVTEGLEKPKTLEKWRELESDPTKCTSEEEKGKLAEFLLSPVLVPSSILAQRYLLNVINGNAEANESLLAIDSQLPEKMKIRTDFISRQLKMKSRQPVSENTEG